MLENGQPTGLGKNSSINLAISSDVQWRRQSVPWLNICEQFFRGQRTLEEQKMWLASYHLTSLAQQWYFQLERDEGILSWARFADFVNLRFGPPIRSNSLDELAQIRQTGSVEDYQKQFLALLCRVEPLSPL